MKILLINDLGAPVGGAETDMVLLRETLREQGHDARFFSGSASPTEAASEADYTCFSTLSTGLAMMAKVFNPFAVVQLKRVLAEFQPDVVHLRMFLDQLSPFILSILGEYPVLLYVCDYRYICPIGTKILPNGEFCNTHYGSVCLKHCLPAARWLPLMAQMAVFLQMMTGAIDRVVVCSESVREKLEAHDIKVDHLIPQGSQPVRLDSALPQLSEQPTLVYAGRLVWKKGVDVLIRSMPLIIERYPDVTLKILGYGPERDTLQESISELGLESHVQLVDFLPRHELERVLEHSWFQILPSRWEEPFGIVMNEAMLRGTVFIAPVFGGPSEVIEHGETGVIFSPYTPEGLADSINWLLEQPERIGRIRTQARSYALEKLTILEEARQLVRVYEHMLQEHSEHEDR